MSHAQLRHEIALKLWRFMWNPGRWFMEYFTDLEIKGEENIKGLPGPLIVAANHFHTLDAFFIGAAIPKYSKITPIRYGVWHKYYWHFWNFPFVWILGCFEVHRGGGLENVLKRPLQLLREGRVVGIFPEGSRRKLGRPRKGRRGAPYLAIKTKTPILPIYIHGAHNMSYIELFLKKRRIQIIIGKPFRPKKDKTDDESLRKMGNYVMEKIRKLEPSL